jgi:hypothetical protein
MVIATPRPLYYRKWRCAHCSWVGPRAGLAGAENVFTGILSPERPARSYLLYRLRCPSSKIRYKNYLSKLIGKDEFCKIASVPVLLYWRM